MRTTGRVLLRVGRKIARSAVVGTAVVAGAKLGGALAGHVSRSIRQSAAAIHRASPRSPSSSSVPRDSVSGLKVSTHDLLRKHTKLRKDYRPQRPQGRTLKDLGTAVGDFARRKVSTLKRRTNAAAYKYAKKNIRPFI